MSGRRLWKKISVIIFWSLSVSLIAHIPVQAAFDEKVLVEKSEKFSEQMATGNFERVANEFTDEMEQQLTVDQLRAVWHNTASDIGQYQGIYKTEVSIRNNQANVAVVLNYERRGLTVILNYDANNQINGLFIRYSALPVSHEAKAHEKFEESEILIGSGEVRLKGLFTLPTGVKHPSIVILLHGSGPADMDGTIGMAANKPFQDIAHGLAEQGIASIRYNKRTWQYPELFTNDSTIQDEVVDDAMAAIQYAKHSNLINPQKIYILGHSMGGMLSPYIAKVSKDVAGIIVLAGSPRKLEDIILSQNIALINANADQSQKDAIMSQLELEIAKVKAIKPTDAPTTILGVSSSYWSSLNEINTPLICKELQIPMLIMQGERDFQVLADVDYKMWQELLQGRDNVEFNLYKGLNHLFMPVNGAQEITTFQTAYDASNHVDKAVIVDIAEWIHKLE